MTGHVFISYARNDRPYVDQLVPFLAAAGLTPWVDHELDVGDRWTNVIRDQIDACAALVPIMSSRSEDSQWVAREILRAESMGKPILPLLLQGRPFFRLADLQYVDVTGGRMPGPDFVDRLRRTTGSQHAETYPQTLTMGRAVVVPAVPGTQIVPPPAGKTIIRRRTNRALASIAWPILVIMMVFAIMGSFLYFTTEAINRNGLGGSIATQACFTLVTAVVALAVYWIHHPGALEITDTALVRKFGRKTTTYPWVDLAHVQVGDGRLVLVPQPTSALAERMRVDGEFESGQSSVVVCRTDSLRVAPYQVLGAIRLRFPGAAG